MELNENLYIHFPLSADAGNVCLHYRVISKTVRREFTSYDLCCARCGATIGVRDNVIRLKQQHGPASYSIELEILERDNPRSEFLLAVLGHRVRCRVWYPSSTYSYGVITGRAISNVTATTGRLSVGEAAQEFRSAINTLQEEVTRAGGIEVEKAKKSLIKIKNKLVKTKPPSIRLIRED